MDINKINGTQLCKNCVYCGEKGKCKNSEATQVWATNQRNGCDYFHGELVQIDWSKAIPVGARPSTFSKGSKLIRKNKMLREDMNREQEIKFVNEYFENYEKEGFSKVFISPYDLGGKVNRQGTPFKVLGRIRPLTQTDKGPDTADLETLPLWNIQFEDGETMGAYPEEIIPSAIKENLWRESDKQYLKFI
jgi:hypothetical protein